MTNLSDYGAPPTEGQYRIMRRLSQWLRLPMPRHLETKLEAESVLKDLRSKWNTVQHKRHAKEDQAKLDAWTSQSGIAMRSTMSKVALGGYVTEALHTPALSGGQRG